MQDKKQLGIGAVIGVMAIFFLPNASFIINPAIAALAEAFPDVAYSNILMLSTISSIVVIPISVVAGSLAGSKFGFKTLTVFASICLIVGGMIPFFVMDYYVLLLSRVIIGVGVGFSMPLGNAIVMKLFSGQKGASIQGAGTAVMNASGIIFQQVAGILCVLNLKYIWLLHLLVLVPMGCIIAMLPEPEKEEVIRQAEKTRLPMRVYLISAGYALCVMFFYPLFLNVSAIVVGEGLGSAALSGTILSMYNIGGCIAGVIFGKVYQVLEKKTIPVCLILLVVFLAVGYFGHSAVLLMIAIAGCGITLFIIWPAIMVEFNDMMPPQATAAASGTFVALLNLGCFTASPYVGLLQKVTGNMSPRFPTLVAIGAVALIALIWIGLRASRQSKPAK